MSLRGREGGVAAGGHTPLSTPSQPTVNAAVTTPGQTRLGRASLQRTSRRSPRMLQVWRRSGGARSASPAWTKRCVKR